MGYRTDVTAFLANKKRDRYLIPFFIYKLLYDDYPNSIKSRCALRTALFFFIRFSTEGFVKYARRFTSFKTPERSYFFLKRRSARSMFSFS